MKGHRGLKWLKPVRVVISLAFFLLTVLLFSGLTGIYTAWLFETITFLQFFPSLVSFITVLSTASAGFILIIMLTFLAGRIVCSTVCPLGTFQDLVIRLKKIFSSVPENIRDQNSPGLFDIIHFLITGAVTISLFTGSLLLLSLLDPFTLSGNFFSLVLGFPHWDGVGIPAAIFTFLMILIVIITNLFRGRWFCNALCPAGGIYRLISKISLFKLTISPSVCTGCNDCQNVCKAGCIDRNRRRIDFEKCVCCFNCISACQENAISIGIPNYKLRNDDDGLSSGRRFFLKSVIGGGAVLFSSSLFFLKEKAAVRSPVMPPGAKDLYNFTDHCTACHLCVENCPTNVLQPGFLDYGLSGIFQPKMDFSRGFCINDCTRCGTICPTCAIFALSKEEKLTVQTGIAIYVRNLCLVVKERKSCSVCADHCPNHAIRMAGWLDLRIPEVLERYCTGCGICEYSCPARPERAIYIESNRFHRVAMIRKKT